MQVDIDIRKPQHIDDFRQLEALQQQIWGFEDRDMVPSHEFLVTQKSGGLVLTAHHQDRLIGFLFGTVGLQQDGRLQHCSRMLGVLPDYRHQGIGHTLKCRQRRFVLGQGIPLVTWTFDPLESRNAYLNTVKLGGICRRYLPNFYGEMQDSLNQGLPSDRLELEWWVDSARVQERIDTPTAAKLAESPATSPLLTQTRIAEDGVAELQGWQFQDAPTVRVEVPASIQRVKGKDIALAHGWRIGIRECLMYSFSLGYVLTDVLFDRGSPERSFYVLTTSTRQGPTG